jgi:hypothetical protein
MKPIPIHQIAARIKRLSLAHQIHHLRALVAVEPPRSIRRGELESLLKDKLLRQIKKECRAA